jgi:hypothetical protein
LAAGASATVTITATAPASGPLRNTASVASNTPDRATGNNSIAQETRVTALPSISGRVAAGGASLPGVTLSLIWWSPPGSSPWFCSATGRAG